MKDKLMSVPRAIWKSLSHNFWLKLLSLGLAVLLWGYVVVTNPDITRTKTLTGLTGYVTNLSTLSNYGLALLTDTAELLKGVSVRLEVPQASYSLANADNVQVTLDMSSVRTAGTKEVNLRATTGYGRVLNILPESLTLTFEALDSRSIPVNVALKGTNAHNWYNVSRINPEEVVIGGASSVVQMIDRAYVYPDVTDRTDTFVTAQRFVLLDANGNEISQTMLTRNSSSISTSIEIYPTKELPISNDIADVIKGVPAAGYEIASIEMQPEYVTVAADEELLSALTDLLIEPVSVEGAMQSFSQRSRIVSLADFKYISSEQAYVNINITECSETAAVNDVRLSFAGKADGYTITWQREELSAKATGKISAVEALVKSGVDAVINLTGLGEGEFELPITVAEGMYPGITLEFMPATLVIALTAQD